MLLDLQYAFDRLYDEGPYRRAVDYARPPDPPLLGEEAAWAEEVAPRAGRVLSLGGPPHPAAAAPRAPFNSWTMKSQIS